jgi:hypothetical protein
LCGRLDKACDDPRFLHSGREEQHDDPLQGGQVAGPGSQALVLIARLVLKLQSNSEAENDGLGFGDQHGQQEQEGAQVEAGCIIA